LREKKLLLSWKEKCGGKVTDKTRGGGGGAITPTRRQIGGASRPQRGKGGCPDQEQHDQNRRKTTKGSSSSGEKVHVKKFFWVAGGIWGVTRKGLQGSRKGVGGVITIILLSGVVGKKKKYKILETT